ncbi:MFS transporter [Pseudomonas sp. C1C7]|uniref:MFS transporter n=1 Tax=Pseudomonas sp. C1C7 TaxID=2735272 RepID=UPI001585F00C|nr:MFS transporter [Pseudomonas sp. C1C7]NUT78690.1 MFS transporter [Pseudomonas sp. C1C7]
MNSTTAVTAASPPTRSIRWALASLSLSMLLSSLGTSIANVGLPTLAQVFDASFQQVQWVVLAYLLAITTLIVSVGRLGDLAGRRRLLLSGIGLFTVASALCGLAPSLELLIGARTLQGLGAAIMMALTLAFVGETVPKDRTGSAMGLLGTLSAIGTAMGPSLGGLLIGEFGWRGIFLITVPLGLLTLLLAQRYLPADQQQAKNTQVAFDSVGTLLLALTLAAYALAMTLGRGQFGVLNLALILLAGVGAWVFVRVEQRVTEPLVRLAMFHDRQLTTRLIMSLLVATVMMGTLVVGPFYLSQALGLGAVEAGLVLSVGPLVAALTGVPAGRIADRFGARRMTLAGLLVIALGCLLLAVLPISFGVVDYIVPMVVITLGYAVFQTANNTLVMADVQAQQRGVVSGMLNLSRNLGLITGASALGAVFAAAGMRVTFVVALALIALACRCARRH